MTDVREIAGQISPGDLLAFGYPHSGHDFVFETLGERSWKKSIDVFMPCVFRYRRDDIFHLDRVCEKFDGRLLVTQVAPEYAGLLKSGKIDLLPLTLSQVPAFLKEQAQSRRVWVFCEIGEPDDKGFCSTGYSAPFPLDLYEKCICIGMINRKMPATYGDTSIPAKSFRSFVNMPAGLPFFPEPEVSDITRTIGVNAAQLIENGSTIEGGIGEIIASVLAALEGKSDLKFQSGCMAEDIKPLVDKGVITGRSSGNITGARSAAFYDWITMNPAVELRTMEYTHSVLQMCRNTGFVALGSALAVDLLGQVACETIGVTQITGIGGALDFARASGLAGGRSIIAMASTYGKNVSKIVPLFEKGDVVSLSRYDVDYVVTEYGVAELKFKSRRDRALNLISAAHPENREWLLAQAKQFGII